MADYNNIAIISLHLSNKPDDIIRVHGRERNCGFALSRLAKFSPGKIWQDFYKKIDKFGGANPRRGINRNKPVTFFAEFFRFFVSISSHLQRLSAPLFNVIVQRV